MQDAQELDLISRPSKANSIRFSQFAEDCRAVAENIPLDKFDKIVAITRGGLVAAGLLGYHLSIKKISTISISSYNKQDRGQIEVLCEPGFAVDEKTLFVDDLYDSGQTYSYIREKYPQASIAVIYNKSKEGLMFDCRRLPAEDWIEFPWEVEDLVKTAREKAAAAKAIEQGAQNLQSIKPFELFEPIESISVASGNRTIDLKPKKAKNKSKRPPAPRIEDVNATIYSCDDPPFPLSKEQKVCIKSIESGKYNLVLLTGKAGAGKSTIIKNLLFRNPDWKICSTTGKSALLVNGVTVDKFFTYSRDKDMIMMDSTLARNMKACGTTIIIDEASMMGMKMFNRIYAECLKWSKNLVLVGDWGQASPVKDTWAFYNPKFAEDIVKMRLTECFRQKGGQFLQALDNIRVGYVGPAEDEMFSTRVHEEIPGDEYVKLFATNKKVNDFNEIKVIEHAEKHNQQIFTLYASLQSFCKYPLTEERIKRELEESMLAHDQKFCVGCKVLITRNSSTGEFVNGDTGVLLEYDAKSGSLSVLLDRNNQIVLVGQATNIKEDASGEPEIIIDGYPIKPGYALTVHKCVTADTFVEVEGQTRRIVDLPTEKTVLSIDGDRQFSNFKRNFQSKIFELSTKEGYGLKATEDHGVSVWNGKAFCRQNLAEIKQGSYIRLKLGMPFRAESIPLKENVPGDCREIAYPTPKILTEDLAQLIGIIFADGVIYKNTLRTAKADRNHALTVQKLIKNCFAADTKIYQTKASGNCWLAEINSASIIRWLSLNFPELQSNNKRVPELILRAGCQEQIAFLFGVLEDGYYNIKEGKLDHMQLFHKDRDNIKVLQYMLLKHGIASKISECRGLPVLYVFGGFAKKLFNKGKMISKGRADIIQKAAEATPAESKNFRMPISAEELQLIGRENFTSKWCFNDTARRGWISRSVASRILEEGKVSMEASEMLKGKLDWLYCQVDKVSVVDYFEDTYCIEVEDTHRFIQNGIDGWNSQGMTIPKVWVDMEDVGRMHAHGLAYVALSRVRDLDDLLINKWVPSAIYCDPDVRPYL